MVYLLNTEISDKKIIKIALQNIFGVGKFQVNKICNYLGISLTTKVRQLTPEMKNKIVVYIESNLKIGDDLNQFLAQAKENQMRIKCYKGQRAKFKLPRRGQRTHTNSRTVKKLK